jgi:hypothetical protein
VALTLHILKPCPLDIHPSALKHHRQLQLLTIASSDDSGVIERASKTLKRIAKAEAQVNRLAEQRERTVMLSREHSQLHLALSRAPAGGTPPAPGLGGSGSGGGAGGGSGGGIARSSLGAGGGPSRVTSVRSMRGGEHAVSGAAVGAGAGGPTCGAAGCRVDHLSLGGLPAGAGAASSPGLGRPPASAGHVRGWSESRAPWAGAGDGEHGHRTSHLGANDANSAITAWRTSSIGHDGQGSGGGAGSSSGGASSGNSGGGAPYQMVPPPHLRLAMPPDGTSPVRPSPRAAASARLHAARSVQSGSGGGLAPSHRGRVPIQAQRSLPDMRGTPNTSAGGQGDPSGAVRTPSSLLTVPAGPPRRGADLASFSNMLQQHDAEGQQQQQLGRPSVVGVALTAPPSTPSGGAGGATVISIASPGEEAEDHVLVPIGSARSDECAGQPSGAAPGERRSSLSGLPPIEPATSPVLLDSMPQRASIGMRLRGILNSSGSSERQQRARRQSLGASARDRLLSVAQLEQQQQQQQLHHHQRAGQHIEMHRLTGKHRQEEDEGLLDKEGLIGTGMLGSHGSGSGSSHSGGSDGGAAARARWALVRASLESGRLLRLPYDANNYSIVTSTFK